MQVPEQCGRSRWAARISARLRSGGTGQVVSRFVWGVALGSVLFGAASAAGGAGSAASAPAGAAPSGGAGAHGAEKKPWLQLPLRELGFPGVSIAFLGTGSSVLTVNFLDDKHLLVTYGLRKLVPRLEQDPGDHEDRLVAAEIVDLPTGHVAAKTEWHLHDHGRYLWPLGGGRFLVRMGERLYTMAPLRNLEARDPFQRTVFVNGAQRPSLVVVSPDGAVVTLETVYTAAEPGKTKVVLGDQDTAAAEKARTAIQFFRLVDDEGAVKAVPAGSVQSAEPLYLPVDADGYLWAEDAGAGMWRTTFDPFGGGKTVELGKIKSSCPPRLQMTSRSEFLALTCQGGEDRIKLSSFGLDGRETWEEMLGDFGRPNFAFAAAAGRFAVSGSDSADYHAGVGPNEPSSGPHQEVRVYQNASGDLLLRVACTPTFKTAENFDLSADGLLAAVVREGAIAVYQLPPPSKRDQDDMAEIAAFAPPASTAELRLTRISRPVRRENTATVTGATAVGVPAGAASLGPQADAAEAMGSSGPAPRKPPTLLNPGEKPEFGRGNAEPN